MNNVLNFLFEFPPRRTMNVDDQTLNKHGREPEAKVYKSQETLHEHMDYLQQQNKQLMKENKNLQDELQFRMCQLMSLRKDACVDPHLIDMGYDDTISFKATTQHPNNIYEGVYYIEKESNNNHSKQTNDRNSKQHVNANDEYEEYDQFSEELYCDTNEHQPEKSLKAHIEHLVVPVYIKIPNRGNSDSEYEIHDKVFVISSELYPTVRVTDILNVSLQTLNMEMSMLRPAEYHIMKSSPEMISKSFCDITSQFERLKYLTQFNKHDVIFKGLRLFCSTMSDDSADYQRNLQTLMGLDHTQYVAEDALMFFGNDLDQASQYLNAGHRKRLQSLSHKGECENDISKCKSIPSLSKRLNTLMCPRSNDSAYEQLDVLDGTDCTDILNEFHHILTYHGVNDDEFDYILNAFDGTCDLEHCEKIRRYYRVDEKDDRERVNDNINKNRRFIEDLLDQIHCYVNHGYDTFRFTKDERKQLKRLMDETDVKRDGVVDHEEYFNLISTILERKKTRFNSVVLNNRFIGEANKFSSNMGQIVMRSEQKDDEIQHGLTNRMTSYSFSYDFNYLDKCKHSTQMHSSGLTKDFYVPPKHNSLKDELLYNSISQIDLYTWIAAYQRAEEQKKSSQYRHTSATFGNGEEGPDYWRDDSTLYYGYKEGDHMELKHLICLNLYCSEG
eukprot:210839_1